MSDDQERARSSHGGERGPDQDGAAADFLDGALAAIEAALKKGEKVSLVGFGTFRTVPRKARQGRNPRPGVPLKIKARRVVAFRPGAVLARAVK